MAELAREFEPTYETIRKWVQQAELDEGSGAGGPKTDEKEELRRLRREVRQLKLEREILAKAAAWFARETDSVPNKSSSS
jgi:transposase